MRNALKTVRWDDSGDVQREAGLVFSAPEQERRRERPVFSQQGMLSRVVLGCATILMLGATGIMVLEGLSRHFFGVSYFWAEESVRFLLVWAFFLTLGIAGFQHCHIRTELFVQKFPPAGQRACWLVACITGMAFASILAYSSVAQVSRYYSMGMLSESNLELPMWMVFLAMPLGGIALFLYYAFAAWYACKWGDPFAPEPEPDALDEATINALAKGPQL